MKVSVESVGPTQRRVSVGVDAERVEKELAKTYRELSRHSPVRGFRPGKAPRHILERLFGTSVREEVKGRLVEETVKEALAQEKLDPVAPPIVEKSALAGGGWLDYTVLVDVKPEIDPRDYLGIELKPEPAIVTEQEVDDQLEALRNAHAELRGVEEKRPLRRGDFAVIAYEGRDEAGANIPGFKADERQLEVGAGSLPREIDEALEGMMAGETREVDVSFPPAHPSPKIAGKRVRIRVEVKAVKEKILPALDDEFAKDVGDHEGLESLRSATRERLRAAAEEKMRARRKDDLVRVILERNPFEAPRPLVEEEVRTMVGAIAIQTGTDPSRWGDEEIAKLRSQLTEPATARVRRSLLLDRIAEKEGIPFDPADLEAQYERLARAMGQNVLAIKAEFEKPEKKDRLEGMKSQLRETRVLDFLLGRATIVGG